MLLWLLLLLELLPPLRGEAPPAAAAAFDAYTAAVEQRLAERHRSAGTFLKLPDHADALQRGEVLVERVPIAELQLQDSMLHHWRGTAFVPGAAAADLERLLRDFRAYPQRFAPEVEKAGLLRESGDRMQAWMRVRQHHVLTVVVDAVYDVRFERLDAGHGYSISRSTQIREIGSPGTRAEHALTSSEEHGFLWRLNSYWSYEERDGGLYLQLESVSLTRAVPSGLGWALRPYIESIPRESMEFTLRSASAALRMMGGKQ